ncbi:MAG: hypothetical protein ACE5ES_03950 [Candidatus Nanoarchaeia archaeon]
MNEIIKLFIGIVVLILGWPIGNYLAKVTKDEQKQGQKWFKLITLLGLIGGVVGLIIRNDVILFSFFFIAIVASRSVKKKINFLFFYNHLVFSTIFL